MNLQDTPINGVGETIEIESKIKDEKTTLESRWKQLLKLIRGNVSLQVFKTWFIPIKPLKFEGNELVVQVPSQFYCEWLDQHYFSLIRTAVHRFFGEQISLKYHIIVDKSIPNDSSIKLPSSSLPSSEQIQKNIIQKLDYSPNLVPNYSFENFVVGDCNQFAYSTAFAVAKNPNQPRYNPLILYGNTGLGKTHLIQAIGNHILLNHPSVRVLYSTSENFANNFIDAIKNNNMNSFVNHYRNIDVLLVDDIQFFQNKGKIQDHFFHTFNALHQVGKQIVLTSDKAPKQLKDLDERLISRFQWGVIADIQPPELETRIAITRKKSENEGLELPEEVVEYIAQNVVTNVREIEGVIVSLFATIAFSKRKPSIELVREILRAKHIRSVRVVTIDKIKSAVAHYFNIKADELESKSRKKEIMLPRQLAMYLSKELTNSTLITIGQSFGGRDHTTVLHSINIIERNLLVDERVKSAYEYISRKLI